jgi:hypothetical protein
MPRMLTLSARPFMFDHGSMIRLLLGVNVI